MTQDKINIAELLRNCPKGMELYSPLCGECYFDRLNMGTIICKKQNTQEITFTSKGYYMLPVFDDCECVLFPSKENRDWNKFQRPFKDGDILSYQYKDFKNRTIYIYMQHSRMNTTYYVALSGNSNSEFMINDKEGHALNSYNDTVRLATEEEKQKLFQAIKDNGYKWNSETKTLEKLPKFKVGDKVRNKTSLREFEIQEIKWDRYILKNGNYIAIGDEDWYELVIDKFDISKLIPFESRVLIRDDDGDLWKPAIYGFSHPKGCYVVGGAYWKQCIPYEVNKELLGRTNDCDEFYKTWK